MHQFLLETASHAATTGLRPALHRTVVSTLASTAARLRPAVSLDGRVSYGSDGAEHAAVIWLRPDRCSSLPVHSYKNRQAMLGIVSISPVPHCGHRSQVDVALVSFVVQTTPGDQVPDARLRRLLARMGNAETSSSQGLNMAEPLWRGSRMLRVTRYRSCSSAVVANRVPLFRSGSTAGSMPRAGPARRPIRPRHRLADSSIKCCCPA